jgi:hypothetical protein
MFINKINKLLSTDMFDHTNAKNIESLFAMMPDLFDRINIVDTIKYIRRYPVVPLDKILLPNDKIYKKISHDALESIKAWSESNDEAQKLIDVQRLFLQYEMHYYATSVKDLIDKIQNVVNCMV